MRIKMYLFLLGFCISFQPIHAADHVRQEKKNLIAGFLGGTNEQNKHYFTYGLEYHRILALPLGISFNIEDTPNNKEQHHEVETIGLITINVLKNISIGFGPGLKFEEGKSRKILGRCSLDYIFLTKSHIEIIPNVSYDMVKNDFNELVYGLTIGKQF